jgi:N-acetylneuraminic acid mutarotase
MKPTIFSLLVLSCFAFFNIHDSYAQGVWTSSSSTGFTERGGLTSSVVNGKIYVIGGLKGSQYLNTVEVFDPGTNTWSTPSTTGNFPARFAHTASVLNDKIYVIGGYNNSALKTVLVFDPVENTWTTLSTTGIFAARDGHCASVINGKIYVIGGNNQNNIAGVAVFDPVANTWTSLNPTGTFTPRFGLVSSVVNGKIYTFGGSDGTHFFNTVEVYDPIANSWSTPTTTGYFTPRESPGLGYLADKIYIMGGDTNFTINNYTNIVEMFDPATNSWSTPMTTGTFTNRAGLACSEFGGKIYALGGVNGNSLNTNEVFIPALNSITSEPASSVPRVFPNPSTGILNVQNAPTDELTVTIENILGNVVMAVNKLHSTNFSLDLSKLIPGTYYIRFSSANSVVTKMVVRE